MEKMTLAKLSISDPVKIDDTVFYVMNQMVEDSEIIITLRSAGGDIRKIKGDPTKEVTLA